MKRTPVALAVALSIVGPCACGDDSSKAASVPSVASSAPQASASTAPAAVATTVKPATATAAVATTAAPKVTVPAKLPDACAFVTKEQIAAAYGATASDGKLSADADNQCVFTISGTSKAGKVDLFDEVSVQIDFADRDSSYERAKVVAPTAVKVDLGDDAWSLDVIVYQLHITKGKYELEIDGPLLADKQASKQAALDLAKVLLPKL